MKRDKMIPKFKNTEDAINFGETATPQQILQLRKARKRALNISDALITKGKHQQALDKVFTAQFYREAIEASEMQNT